MYFSLRIPAFLRTSPFTQQLRLAAAVMFGLAIGAAPLTAATVRGMVTDPNGGAAAGAHVRLVGPIGTVATTRTDDSGTYTFANVGEGRYEIRVVLTGFRADPETLIVAASDDRQVPIQLALAAVSEQVIVSAAQVDTALSHTPDSVTVLTSTDLQSRQIDGLADALRLVPGLAVVQSGSHGALTSVFPRGGESDFTLVLIDGVRTNTFGGGFDFGQVPIANVERIEVVRGPQSALHGSDAIGAVVQIVTRRGGSPAIEAVAERGGYDTGRMAVSSAGGLGAWEWGVAAERITSQGRNGDTARGATIDNDDFAATQATMGGGWRPGARTFLRGQARFASDERGFPGPLGSDPGGSFGGIDRISRGENETRLLSVSAAHGWSDRVTQRVQLSYADLDGRFVSPFGESDSATTRWSGRAQTDVALAGGLSASAGIEVQRERADSTFITGETFEPIPGRRRVVGYFAEGRFERDQRLFVTAGFRLEQIRRSALAGNPSPFGARPPFATDSVLSPNPKLAAGWFVQPATGRSKTWTRLHGSAGTGIRPPTAFEIAFTDNPRLRPERSRSFDAGIEQAFGGGAVLVDATTFVNTYDDLIVAVGRSVPDSSRYQTDNISNARARGLELSFAARTPWGLDARASYSWLQTEILDLDRARGIAADPFFVGDPLIRRPRHQGAVDVALTRGRLTSFVRVGARGTVLDIDPSSGAFGGLFDAAGFAVVHAGATVRVRGGVEVFARVMNLLDRSYEEVLGFPAPGRSAHVGLRIAASR